MKNITVATKENIGYYNILTKSCKKYNVQLVVLGLGQKWEGFTMRFKLWLDYLNKLNNNEIVMINDAYDVIILQDSKIIRNKFLKFNTKIVFSGEISLIRVVFPSSASMGLLILVSFCVNNFGIIFFIFNLFSFPLDCDTNLLLVPVCRSPCTLSNSDSESEK